MRPATLHSHGWIDDWTTVTALLTDAACAWADLDGFHLRRCPAELPHSSHLWAWRGDTCWRARIDSGRTLLTELTVDPTETATTTIEVQQRPGVPWPADYHAIGPQTAGILDGRYTLYVTPNHIGDNGSATGVAFISGPAA